VITGRQCQPDAGRDSCVVTAHDAKTGKELWRFHTIPGPGEPGDESWGNVPMNERWHVGTWMVVCSQNGIRRKIPLCLVIRLRGRSLFREPSKWVTRITPPKRRREVWRQPATYSLRSDIERPFNVVGAPRVLIAAKVGQRVHGELQILEHFLGFREL
jgi:hypothetical protein